MQSKSELTVSDASGASPSAPSPKSTVTASTSWPSTTFRDPKTNAHLLKHDSNYGHFPGTVEVTKTASS
jgi:hypothetical protein